MAGDSAGSIGELLTGLGLSDPREIGRGATSTVYVARQAHLSRDVALKVFASPLENEKARRRFERECQALGTVSTHPNVVTLLSNGFDAERRPYIMMEYCPGGSLYDVINSSGPLAVADVLRLGVKLGSALQLAHDNGLLHRDIKPANVLLTAWQEPALADFGIAGDAGELSLTIGESLTPLYAAPEVLESGGGSTASDIWSLASTLYALLLGRAPYAGTNDGLLAVLRRIVEEPLPPLVRDDVPEVLLAALARGMQKDPKLRTPSARALAEDLRTVQAELGLTVTEYLSPDGRLLGGDSPDDPADLTRRAMRAAPKARAVAEPIETSTVVSASTRRTTASAAVGQPTQQPGEQSDRSSAKVGAMTWNRRSIALVGAAAVVLAGGLVGGVVSLSGGSRAHATDPKASLAAVAAALPKSFATRCDASGQRMGCRATYMVPATAPHLVYRWSIGGRSIEGGQDADFSFESAGAHTVSLKVAASGGQTLVRVSQSVVVPLSYRRLGLRTVRGNRLVATARVRSTACQVQSFVLQRKVAGGAWRPVRSIRSGRSGLRHVTQLNLGSNGPGVYRVTTAAEPVGARFCSGAVSRTVTVQQSHHHRRVSPPPSISPPPGPAPSLTPQPSSTHSSKVPAPPSGGGGTATKSPAPPG
jgi:serine/threonine protein kinase